METVEQIYNKKEVNDGLDKLEWKKIHKTLPVCALKKKPDRAKFYL